MSDSKFKMIAGLGNPGQTYSRTRHNIGFLVVGAIAGKSGLDFNKTRFDAAFTRARIHGQDVFLVKPLSFMNRSGVPLQKLSAYFKIPVTDIIVVHDDMDLAFGSVKIVENRGPGGHNGVKSIQDAFGSRDCIRVRVGVGHPGGPDRVTGHVLGDFTPEEQACLDDVVTTAADACRLILSQGVVRAMNQVNTRR
ncbi:MAG: aminoacyl-tRNA hydrolase [Desulfotignum sp.]|nr:aminoacyl-tRNA hydrolase [Desulfotignum sp.]MCF8112274.1 aminoacyl-tRNA hydrolase [Desulfotignum sp.]MCF8124652.1 aminoacyl-tRNA hydrolase [Desulfotignum sp.]